MKILLNNNDLNEALGKVTNLGFVPTMGSLHKGHISLIKRSLKECKYTIVSIFGNPYQFNNKNDYKNYPRNIKKDLYILKNLKTNFAFVPSKKVIYSSNVISKKRINKNDQILCAKFRKGHFEGVLEVMDRLTKLIKPSKIYLGKKDYQQLYLVKKFIERKYQSKIITCETIRDKYHLALSSRNFLLRKKDLIKARFISKNLKIFKKKLVKKKNINDLIIKKKRELSINLKINFDYLELRNLKNLELSKKITNSNIFYAYTINGIRLIDNL